MSKKPWLMSAVLGTFVIGSFCPFSPLYSVSHAEKSQIASLEDYDDIQRPSDIEIAGQEEEQLSVISTTYNPSKFLTLFDRKKIVQNFRSMDKVFPSRTIRHDKQNVFRFKKDLRKLPNFTYTYNGQARKFKDLLARTGTTGLLIIKDDKILVEKYYLGNSPKSLNTSWSVSKAFVSALIGIALDEGAIRSVNDPITDYLPELSQSGYNSVTIQNILNMASGVKYPDFEEPYRSEWYKELFVDQKPFNGQMTTLPSAAAPGTFAYKGSDTQVLSTLLLKVTGKHPADYLEEKIWKPLGMESHAYWNTDLHGDELAFAFLNATLRDYAKFGRLYLKNGNWNGKQLISEAWVKETYVGSPGMPFYKHQWWLPGGRGEIMASGIYGQSIYVNQNENIVIVKTSVNTQAHETAEEGAAFREAINQLKKK
ncbi:serine hydrolase domain-containing protein [Paenibacillus elgii]